MESSKIRELISELIFIRGNRDWVEDIQKNATPIMKQLVEVGEPATDLIIDQMLKDEDWVVREDAVVMLNHMKAEKAIEPLLQMLNTDSSFAVQSMVAYALENFGTSKAIGAVENWRSQLSPEQYKIQKRAYIFDPFKRNSVTKRGW